MDASELFDSFDQLLSEEREAIRRLDGGKVDALAQRKLALMASINALSSEELSKHVGRMTSLSLGLRRNGVLLVHARSIIRDALRIKGAQIGEMSALAARAGRPNVIQMARPRLSVRG